MSTFHQRITNAETNLRISKNQFGRKPKVIVVLGPTASGKSDLAVKLALQLRSGQARKKLGINGAEIISADSRQVYRGMDIGSGKVPRDKISNSPSVAKAMGYYFYHGIRHHLLDVASPRRQFTVSQYQKLGKRAIEEILAKNKLPIICGGTGFYIDSLIYDYRLPSPPPNKKLRAKLEKLSTGQLFAKLKKLDPHRAANIDRHNPRRLVRALEIVINTKRPVPELKKESPYDVLKIGMSWPKDVLRARIHKRLLARMRQRLVAEVQKLRAPAPRGFGLSWKKLEGFGLEYRWLARCLQDKINKKEMLVKLEKDIWHYAKRQMTWWNKDQAIHWLQTKDDASELLNLFLTHGGSQK